MSGTLKIRLRAGVREIEIEGNRSDVDDLLSKWWTSVDSAQTENETETETETENSIERTARTPKCKNRPAAARSARGAISADSESAFDPNSIANQIKERKDFGNLQQKILHKKDSYNKIALILWISDTPLTSSRSRSVGRPNGPASSIQRPESKYQQIFNICKASSGRTARNISVVG
jgi:hypothetical protein